MKRLMLFSFALMATLMSWAIWVAPSDFRVICKDGSIAYYHGWSTELTFDEDGCNGYLKIPFVGKIKIKDAVKI